MSVRETAGVLNVGERHIRRLMAEDKLVYHKFGRTVRVAATDVDDYIERCRVDRRAATMPAPSTAGPRRRRRVPT